MDKKFLKDNNLLESHKAFMRLCEWSYVPQNLEEDDDEENANGQEQTPNNDSVNQLDSTNNEPNDNVSDNAEGGASGDVGQDNQGMTPMDGNNDTSMDMGSNMSPEGMNMPQNNDMGNDMGMEPSFDEQPQGDADETVIDVDDITDAQEKMNTKVNHVGRELGTVDDKIESLINVIDKMEQMINSQNQEIINFKKEFERRNPTQTEKLNLRSLDSYPFNVSPLSYWHNKSIDKNNPYVGYTNNDESTTDSYEITDDDISDYSDYEIEKSFDIDDDLNQDLKKIFNL